MSGNATDSGMVSLNALASIGSNFSIRLCPTDSPEQTDCHFPLDKRPNIILFMVDDMGWQDTSLPFWTQKTHYNELYETPNMERLARQGSPGVSMEPKWAFPQWIV